jgi:hypothetical protein
MELEFRGYPVTKGLIGAKKGLTVNCHKPLNLMVGMRGFEPPTP